MTIGSLAGALEREHHRIDEGIAAFAAAPGDRQPLARAMSALRLPRGERPMGDHELDVRPLRKPDKHPAIFQAYAAVAAGESLVLVNDHDPRHLHDEFEVEHPGGYAWEYLAKDPGHQARLNATAAHPRRHHRAQHQRGRRDGSDLEAPDARA